MMQTHSQQVGTWSRRVAESGKTPDGISAGLFSHTDLRALARGRARTREGQRMFAGTSASACAGTGSSPVTLRNPHTGQVILPLTHPSLTQRQRR